MSRPDEALLDLAALLRSDGSVVSPHVVDAVAEPPVLGALVAAGSRTAAAAGEYALVVEAVREGYLLHYDVAAARLVRGIDPDLALLSGDYLYALGLQRLAALGDLAAVRELADLISLAAQVHDGSTTDEAARTNAIALWLACAVAIAAGSSPAHERAKEALRAGRTGAADALGASAREDAERGALTRALGVAVAGLDSRSHHLPSLG